nr:zinc finger, SWIM-type [Tanacetum cinerariifolium]
VLVRVLRGIMHLGVEIGSEHGGAEEEFSDHDDDNIEDEEHITDELKVNMKGFRFTIDEDWNGLVACIHDMANHGMDVGLPEAWVHHACRLET